ncbi:hypothetical protein [Erwinia pyrifoliae]|uniref:Uncharacterized protein n=1 Tax=Erwinia pyrifoliae TaxID=79967 RepID=A0ABY5XDA8_ERWPY|nr:hypothetical protein [Erwinia pyrifoliae]AUX72643.1 hypothetical protein CPI84_09245 [Erwinia pyrifoliae]MCA8877095.1 hypothetical protein [Erwinia pyrifoliae]MCT2387245.1 hypothetical protein [Erwinia pyrifoliae]MCU8587155.1 hypothetical protein [Erwinia pyrifoliae]UWS31016.1 hypothetical protein NYP81_06070 [Erwinia pyrifoliae]
MRIARFIRLSYRNNYACFGPVTHLSDMNIWQDGLALTDASADERVTAAAKLIITGLSQSGFKIETLDKTLPGSAHCQAVGKSRQNRGAG